MVQNIGVHDVWHHHDSTLCVCCVVIPGTGDNIGVVTRVRHNMDLCLGMLEAQESPGNNRNRVQIVVHASEVGDLQEQE